MKQLHIAREFIITLLLVLRFLIELLKSFFTSFYRLDIVQDTSTAKELTNAEMLEMRKTYETERTSNKLIHPAQIDFEQWQIINNKMLPNARELCEQLRLILEPTKCTRLKGDYRTGRRINMKKVIQKSMVTS